LQIATADKRKEKAKSIQTIAVMQLVLVASLDLRELYSLSTITSEKGGGTYP
jgi:hypothetical protein